MTHDTQDAANASSDTIDDAIVVVHPGTRVALIKGLPGERDHRVVCWWDLDPGSRLYSAPHPVAARQEQEPTLYQVRPRRLPEGEGWREIYQREFENYGEFPGYPEHEWERRKLFTAPPAPAVDDNTSRERDLLASAILDAAVKSGLYRADVSMTGPQLLMACDDLATCIKSAQGIDLGQFRDRIKARLLRLHDLEDSVEVSALLELMDSEIAKS